MDLQVYRSRRRQQVSLRQLHLHSKGIDKTLDKTLQFFRVPIGKTSVSAAKFQIRKKNVSQHHKFGFCRFVTGTLRHIILDSKAEM